MLSLYCQRSQIEDGLQILDLGCGWGSLCLYLAQHYPNSRITAVSNSPSQREYIESQANSVELNNLQVITANVVNFDTDQQFDRVMSIEMFEHMKNCRQLLSKISNWMNSNGLLFVHIFTHAQYAYHFEIRDADEDWLSSHFLPVVPCLRIIYCSIFRIISRSEITGESVEHTTRKRLRPGCAI